VSQEKVELGRYGAAVLRDPDEVPERHRRLVQRAQFAIEAFQQELRTRGEIPADLQPGDVDEALQAKVGTLVILERPELMENLDDAAIAALVTEWPFHHPITPEGARELPGSAYDRLRTACRALAPLLLPNYQAVTDPQEGPDTPFDN
jgi:hypothetical protein